MASTNRVQATVRFLRGPARERLLQRHWVRVTLRTIQRFDEHDGADSAASVSFWALFSLFPLLLGLIAVFSFFLDSASVQRQIDKLVTETLPGARDLVRGNLETIVRLRGTFGVVSIVGLFWSASAIFGAASRAVNRAWGVTETRPFYLEKPRHIALALAIGALLFVSIAATSFAQFLASFGFSFQRSLGFGGHIASSIGARFGGFCVALVMFALMYKLAPNTKTWWRQVWPGALLAALLFEAGKSVFVLYLEKFADYAAAYGSLASVIALQLWLFVSALFLVLGAEFATARWAVREERSRRSLDVGSGVASDASAAREREQGE